MLFSYEWLRRYVEPEAEVSAVADRLTAAGLAVEGMEQRGDDVLLDVEVTTNRPDCMSHLGLAREVAVAFEKPLEDPVRELSESGKDCAEVVAVALDDDRGCPR